MQRNPLVHSARTAGFVTILFALALVQVSTATGTDSGPAFQIRPVESEFTARTLASLTVPTVQPRTGKLWIYFTDKEIFDSESCGRALRGIESGLDDRSRRRRERSMQSSLVDFHDIPVSGAYVAALQGLGAEVVRTSRWLNAASVRASLPVLERISELPFVQRIDFVRGGSSDRGLEPPGLRDAAAGGEAGSPGAGGFDYGFSQPQLEQINVHIAHQNGFSGAGVRVAMFDTGFNYDHIAFDELRQDGRLIAQYDFVKDDGDTQNEPGDHEAQHFHGTYTWSALGGFYETELVGPAHGSEFLLAKTEDIESETPIEEDNWVAAAEWADGLGADVISTSLSYIDWYEWEDLDGNTAPITIAADLAVGRGICVCVSAGNQGGNDWFFIGMPADADSVISVGAVDENNLLAEFSSHGPTWDGRTKPEVVARGLDTYCAIPESFGEPFTFVSGTSLSCPLVGGAAALILEANPTWSPMQVRHALMTTAGNANTPDNDRGWGLIDAWAAMTYVSGVDIPPTSKRGLELVVSPNPMRSTTLFRASIPQSMNEPVRVSVFDIAGREVRRLDLEPGSSTVEWDGTKHDGDRVSPGVYLARLTTGEWNATAKLVVGR